MAAIAEYDGAGAMLARYAFGRMGEPLVPYDSAGARSWMMTDERGSIVAMSDGSGNAILKNTYDEYGKPGAANGGRFMYTGQMYVPEAATYWYKARMYEPALGRFLQPDPIGYDGGMNLYAYVGNDPVNATDPTGLVQNIPTLHLPYSSGGLGFFNLAIQETYFDASGALSGIKVGYADGGSAFGLSNGSYTWTVGAPRSATLGANGDIVVTGSSFRGLNAGEIHFYSYFYPVDLLNVITILNGMPPRVSEKNTAD